MLAPLDNIRLEAWSNGLAVFIRTFASRTRGRRAEMGEEQVSGTLRPQGVISRRASQ